MKNYLTHLQALGDNKIAFDRKQNYIKHNYGALIDSYKNPSVLEIGPGSGSLVHYLNNQGINNIDIIDTDKHVLNYVKKNFHIYNFFLTKDISLFKSKLARYDIIFLLQVFEHIPKSQYAKTIRTLFEKLTPNGQIVIMVPNGANPLNMLERYHDLQHENAFTENSLKELPNYCGIDQAITAVYPYQIPPFDTINLFRIILQKILHFIIKWLIIINGGVYQTIMTPNITLIISKKSRNTK